MTFTTGQRSSTSHAEFGARNGCRRKTFRCTRSTEIDNGQGLDTNAGALRHRKEPMLTVSILVAADCGRLHDSVELT